MFERVKRDAQAFNARFPYLADREKLEEHGKALLIPRLLDDTEVEYRDRVTAASFFLMRAGERAYITGQLDAHFGGRYAVTDEFLDVYVKVRDLAEADRNWLLQFLDGLINPGVRLSVAEWFHFIDAVSARENRAMRAGMNPRDTFNDRSVKLNGRVKLDGRTVNATAKVRPKLNGRFRLDGGINLSGALLLFPATGAVRLSVRLGRGILDRPGLAVKPGHRDTYMARVILNGALQLDGAERLSGYGGVSIRRVMRPRMALFTAFSGIAETARIKVKTGPADCYRVSYGLNGVSRHRPDGIRDACAVSGRLNAVMRYCHRLDGWYRLDGNIKLNGGIPLAV